MWNKVPKREYIRGNGYAPKKNPDKIINDGVIYDPMGQWKYPGEVTKIPGNTMATHGYGNIPLWVVPDNDPARLVQPNSGQQVFPNSTNFTEYPQLPIAQRGGVLLPGAQGRWLDSVNAQFNKQYGGDPSIPDLNQMKKGGWLDAYSKQTKLRGNRGYTSKNIKTSINKLMLRNETLFGPKGKKIYDPMSKFQPGGVTLPKNDATHYYTSDINDPRFQAQRDSSNVYIGGKLDFLNTVRSKTYAEKDKFINDDKFFDSYFRLSKLNGADPKPSSTYIKTYPDFSGRGTWHTNQYEAQLYDNMKPTQQVIYQPKPAVKPPAATPVTKKAAVKPVVKPAVADSSVVKPTPAPAVIKSGKTKYQTSGGGKNYYNVNGNWVNKQEYDKSKSTEIDRKTGMPIKQMGGMQKFQPGGVKNKYITSEYKPKTIEEALFRNKMYSDSLNLADQSRKQQWFFPKNQQLTKPEYDSLIVLENSYPQYFFQQTAYDKDKKNNKVESFKDYIQEYRNVHGTDTYGEIAPVNNAKSITGKDLSEAEKEDMDKYNELSKKYDKTWIDKSGKEHSYVSSGTPDSGLEYIYDPQTGTTKIYSIDYGQKMLYSIENKNIKPNETVYKGSKNKVKGSEISTSSSNTGWYDATKPKPKFKTTSNESYISYDHNLEKHDLYPYPTQKILKTDKDAPKGEYIDYKKYYNIDKEPVTAPVAWQPKPVGYAPQTNKDVKQGVYETRTHKGWVSPSGNTEYRYTDPSGKASFLSKEQFEKESKGKPVGTYKTGGWLDKYQPGGAYNMERALELGYTPDETSHWPSVDSDTGMWLKSKEHPTAWMEYMYGQLNPEIANAYNVRVNPEGYFGNNQLQYVPKKQMGGWLDQYQTAGTVWQDEGSKNLKPKAKFVPRMEPITMNTSGFQKDETAQILPSKYKAAEQNKVAAKGFTKEEMVAMQKQWKKEEDAENLRKATVAAERELRIAKSYGARNKDTFGNPEWRSVLAEETGAIGDKLRISNEENFFDDYINYAAWIGNMATNLGQSPLRAQQEDSYMPYLKAIGEPLVMGAIGEIVAPYINKAVGYVTKPIVNAASPYIKQGLGYVGGKLNKYLPKKINPVVGEQLQRLEGLGTESGVLSNADKLPRSSNAVFSVDDVAINLESQIAKLKKQQVLSEESRKALWSDYKAGNITAEEYTIGTKQLNQNELLESRSVLEKQLKDYNIKQEIVNTPQQNILKSENQLGKNIAEAGISNKGVFELGDNHVARLSAHGYDDASLLVKYFDKIKSPRIAKTLQVKELNGKVYQVQEKVIGTPVERLTETELQNIPKEHIDNFLKDKAELEKLGLYIDFDNVNSNMLYNSKKGFQFIDLGISPVGNNMMAANELFVEAFPGLKLPGSTNSSSLLERINLERGVKNKSNIIKENIQEGNFKINSRSTPSKGLVNVNIKSPTGSIQANINPDGSYGLSFEDANPFNAGKSMLKLKDQLAGKTIHETKSFSTDSYANILNLKKKLPFEEAGFVPLNSSNKANNFLDDLVTKNSKEWSVSANFKSEKAAIEGAKRMDDYMLKLGETTKSKVVNNNGKFEVHVPNYKIKVPEVNTTKMLGIGVPAAVGAAALNQKKLGGWLNKYI